MTNGSTEPGPGMMLAYYRRVAQELRAKDRPPASRQEWERRRGDLIRFMRQAAREWPAEKPPLRPRVIGKAEYPGVTVERLTFESRPGVAVTANVYLPAQGKAPYAAVLCVHGHWPQARVDPKVQERCFGLARLGYVVLAVDAFGSGERGTTPGVAEYHGGVLGASLWPVSTPLWGLQLWDNVRALDYLAGRPEVDRTRIGCTGASGGGNQTMYLAAFDRRVRAAASVCSVGSFQAYLGRACCVDEVMLGGLAECEVGDLLGMVVPRALLVINATQDAPQFSVAEAEKSVARARPVFDLYDAGDRLGHLKVESGHDYNREMREAVYGWFDRWLRDRGDGSPVPEPAGGTVDPAELKCFPGGERPANVATVVGFAHARAQERLRALDQPPARTDWPHWQREKRASLAASLLRWAPATEPAPETLPPDGEGTQRFILRPEPGITGELHVRPPTNGPRRRSCLVLHPEGRIAAEQLPIVAALRARGCEVATLDLRGTGLSANPADALGDIPDHTLCEAALWVGRPLMGQWLVDVRAATHALAGRAAANRGEVFLVGYREAGLLALLAAGLDSRIAGVASVESLASFVTSRRFHEQRMVMFVPDLLRHGDVPHLAALCAPRPTAVLNCVAADGAPADQETLGHLYAWPRAAFRSMGQEGRLTVAAGAGTEVLFDALGLT